MKKIGEGVGGITGNKQPSINNFYDDYLDSQIFYCSFSKIEATYLISPN